MSFLHGFEFIETALFHPIQMVRSSVIGLIGTAPNPAPTNVPTLIMNRTEAVTKFGDPGVASPIGFTIPQALKSIFDQGDFIGFVVVINVLDPATHKTSVPLADKTFVADKVQMEHRYLANEVVKNSGETVTYVKDTDYIIDYSTGLVTRKASGAILAGATVKISYDYADPSLVDGTDIIGGVNVTTGDREGIEALLDVSSLYGFAPKILIAPQYSSAKLVMDALIAKADTLRSVAIADSVEGWKQEDALDYAGEFDSPRAIVSYPLLKNNGTVVPFSPYIAGVMSRTDNTLGWWYSPSNKVILGITGLERPIPFMTFHTPNSPANFLNENKIVTAIHFEGWRVWGNQSATSDAAWKFISVRRQFDIIEDSIELGTLHLLDRPINKAFFEDLTDSVQAFLNSLQGRQAIIYGKIQVLPEDNPPSEIANGHITARLDITPTYPAERITYKTTLTIDPLIQLFENAA